MSADLADIDRTIALWRRQRPPLTAFVAWRALGGKPWSEVTWRHVREWMVDIEARRGGMSIARHKASAARRLREFADPADVGIVDPRTGDPPKTWRRTQELMVGEMVRAEAAEPLTRWQRALL